MMTAAPLYLPDMLPAPSYPCPRRSLRSSVSFFRVNLILSAITCPEVRALQSIDSNNSSRIIPDWSTNLMIMGSYSLLATSVPSSAQTVKIFVALISWVSFCWIHFPIAAIRSFWILGERYCAFFRPAEKWSFNTISVRFPDLYPSKASLLFEMWHRCNSPVGEVQTFFSCAQLPNFYKNSCQMNWYSLYWNQKEAECIPLKAYFLAHKYGSVPILGRDTGSRVE